MTPRVVLIGPPGAGKSSVGRVLAKTLEMEFADTDTLIESDQGKSVGQIFVDDGEPFFRQVEERICVSALENFSGVLSLEAVLFYRQSYKRNCINQAPR